MRKHNFSLFIANASLLSCLIARFAQAQITPDNTLPNNSTTLQGCTVCTIEGGTIRGRNLFHSFREFSVPTNGEAFFNNDILIQNIFSRVTGYSISRIDGVIRANGTANVFLLNPNGITFGRNANLQIGGSFLASTANSFKFSDGTEFSATSPQKSPLLTVDIPIGLQFEGSAKSITLEGLSNSTLQVQSQKTLALIGGDLQLSSGRLVARDGRIELGGLSAPGTVELTVDSSNNLTSLIFPNSVARADVSLARTSINVNEKGRGSIAVNAHNLSMSEGATLQAGIRTNMRSESNQAGDIIINASGAVALYNSGAIQNNVEPRGSGDAGDIRIKADLLTLNSTGNDATTLSTFSFGNGNAGDINVRANRAVLISGKGAAIFSNTLGIGKGGDITITTPVLTLTKNASLSAKTSGKEQAGNISITNTGSVIVQDGASITVGSSGSTGQAGNINIQAKRLILDNKAFISAESASNLGGDITLKLQDFLLLRRWSNISATAGINRGNGDGGNITINTNFLIAAPFENSDIRANAFSGKGGKVEINALGVFWMVPRSRSELEQLLGPTKPNELDSRHLLTNDITAISQGNPFLNGIVTINTPDVDPSRGLVPLPQALLDPSNQIRQTCRPVRTQKTSSFVVTGRGGIPISPERAMQQTPLNQWVTVDSGDRDRNVSRSGDEGQEMQNSELRPTASPDVKVQNSAIVEAQGWVRDAKGNVWLVSDAPATSAKPGWGVVPVCP